MMKQIVKNKMYEISFENAMRNLFYGFLIICPIIFLSLGNWGYMTLRIQQEQMFQIGMILFYAIFMVENTILATFLVLCVANFMIHNFTNATFMLNIFYGIILYQIVYKLVNHENVDRFLKLIVILATMNIAWDAINRLNWDFIYINLSTNTFGTMKGVGFMGIKACYGMILAMSIPLLCYFYPRVAWLLFIPIYTSESSVAMVGGIAGYLFWLYHTSKGWFMDYRVEIKERFRNGILFGVAAILIAGGLLYSYKDSKAGMFSDRTSMWKVVLRDCMKRPLEGWGLDSFRNINLIDKHQKDWLYVKNLDTQQTEHAVFVPEQNKFMYSKGITRQPDAWDNVHNEYISLFFMLGLPGLLCLFFLGKDIIGRLKFIKGGYPIDSMKIALFGFFIVVAILSIGQFPFQLVRTGIFIPLYLAVYYKLTDNEREEYGTA